MTDEHGHHCHCGCGEKPFGLELKDGVARMSETRFFVWTVFAVVLGAILALIAAFDLIEDRVRYLAQSADARAFEEALLETDAQSELGRRSMRKAAEAYCAEELKEYASAGSVPEPSTYERTVAALAENCAVTLYGGCELAKREAKGGRPKHDAEAERTARRALAVLKRVVKEYDDAKDEKDGDCSRSRAVRREGGR